MDSEIHSRLQSDGASFLMVFVRGSRTSTSMEL